MNVNAQPERKTIMKEEPIQTDAFFEDRDSAVIHEILEIVSRQRLTIWGAKRLLQKVDNALELAAFEWDKNKKIPFDIAACSVAS